MRSLLIGILIFTVILIALQILHFDLDIYLEGWVLLVFIGFALFLFLLISSLILHGCFELLKGRNAHKKNKGLS